MSLLHELGALHPGLPALRPASGLVDLHHKEGQDHHGSQEGKHGDGLAHLLVVAARHDPCKSTAATVRSTRAVRPQPPCLGGRLVRNKTLANRISEAYGANVTV